LPENVGKLSLSFLNNLTYSLPVSFYLGERKSELVLGVKREWWTERGEELLRRVLVEGR